MREDRIRFPLVFQDVSWLVEWRVGTAAKRDSFVLARFCDRGVSRSAERGLVFVYKNRIDILLCDKAIHGCLWASTKNG